jgi:hypothetical protein
MKKIILSLFILNYSVDSSQLSTLYNEHAILMTHNSTSLKDLKMNINDNDFLYLLKAFRGNINFVADQNLPVSQQLKDGVRGFKIPLHQRSDGQIYICHTLTRDQLKSKLDAISDSVKTRFYEKIREIENEPCIIDTTNQRFISFLQEINNFLNLNSNEIVTIYLDTYGLDKTSPDSIQNKVKKAFADSGIADKIYYDSGIKEGKAWPTLGKMITDNKRVIIFSAYPHLENLGVFDYSDIVFRTDYDYKSVKALEEDTNKPQIPDGTAAKNKLFMIDNYTTPLIAGSATDAKIVNSYNSLKKRFCQYKDFAGGIKPNILMVDFYQLPNNEPMRFINDWNDSKVDCSK